MKRISFAWTTPAIKAREKTCTRRHWTDSYAQRFNKGDVLMAVESNYRTSNICQIRLTEKPVKEWTDTMPISDWAAEGFDYLDKMGMEVNGLTPRDFWKHWLDAPQKMWVVRFEYLNTPVGE